MRQELIQIKKIQGSNHFGEDTVTCKSMHVTGDFSQNKCKQFLSTIISLFS